MPRHIHIVKIHHLTLSFPTRKDPNPKPILDDVDFGIRDGEILGLIGNSGCGKTMTSLAIAGLLPEAASITSGSIKFAGEDLLSMNPKARRAMLGKDIGMIFQEPSTALDPLMKIGKNLDEVLVAHGVKDPKERREKILSMMITVGFDDAASIYERYPHQLSGGQRQRILIAGAALLAPKLLICDEPTSSLDTVTTVQILDLLKGLCRKLQMTILFISHDLSAVRNFCDRVMVMKDGKIIDKDTTSDILTNPKNAYTAELLTNARLDTRMLGIERAHVDYSSSPVLTAKGIEAGYSDAMFGKGSSNKVLKGVDLEIYPHEILGLIGSSGCGKTTLIRALLGLLPHSGTASVVGRKTGAVFQDPVSCLNPSHTVRWHLNEALRTAEKKLPRQERMAKITAALEEAGLDTGFLLRKPHQLSGGQRQRVAIAMCLIMNPGLIIADEPFSSLDASSAAEILKLLTDINRERGTSFLLVTHNIHIIRQIAPRVIVMDGGKICESGLTTEVLSNPKAPATKRLLDAETKLHGV